MFTDFLGSEADPYDASKTGPLCYQSSLTTDGVADFVNTKVYDFVKNIVTAVLDVSCIIITVSVTGQPC